MDLVYIPVISSLIGEISKQRALGLFVLVSQLTISVLSLLLARAWLKDCQPSDDQCSIHNKWAIATSVGTAVLTIMTVLAFVLAFSGSKVGPGGTRNNLLFTLIFGLVIAILIGFAQIAILRPDYSVCRGAKITALLTSSTFIGMTVVLLGSFLFITPY